MAVNYTPTMDNTGFAQENDSQVSPQTFTDVPNPPVSPSQAPVPQKRVLSRSNIFSAHDVKMEFVPTPEWAEPDDPHANEVGVYVHGMTAHERDVFETEQIEFGRKVKTKVDFFKNFRAQLVSRCTFDENGARLFSDSDVEWLGNKSAAVVSRLSDKIRDLSGMTPEDVEDMAKNSESDRSAGSPTN